MGRSASMYCVKIEKKDVAIYLHVFVYLYPSWASTSLVPLFFFHYARAFRVFYSFFFSLSLSLYLALISSCFFFFLFRNVFNVLMCHHFPFYSSSPLTFLLVS